MNRCLTHSVIPVTGIIPGAVNISLGTLTCKADNEVLPDWCDPNLADRSRPIITACETGEMATLAGKLLKDIDRIHERPHSEGRHGGVEGRGVPNPRAVSFRCLRQI